MRDRVRVRVRAKVRARGWVWSTPGRLSDHEVISADPGYGRGVPFWAFYFSGQGSLARVTPLFLCDSTYSSCFTLAKLIRNAKVI